MGALHSGYVVARADIEPVDTQRRPLAGRLSEPLIEKLGDELKRPPEPGFEGMPRPKVGRKPRPGFKR